VILECQNELLFGPTDPVKMSKLTKFHSRDKFPDFERAESEELLFTGDVVQMYVVDGPRETSARLALGR